MYSAPDWLSKRSRHIVILIHKQRTKNWSSIDGNAFAPLKLLSCVVGKSSTEKRDNIINFKKEQNLRSKCPYFFPIQHWKQCSLIFQQLNYNHLLHLKQLQTLGNLRSKVMSSSFLGNLYFISLISNPAFQQGKRIVEQVYQNREDKIP